MILLGWILKTNSHNLGIFLTPTIEFEYIRYLPI